MNYKTCFIFFLWISIGFAQDKQYALEVLDTLCAPYFDGRGYYDNGEKRAAKYIKNQFEEFGLQPVDNSYYQYFNFSANSIVGKPCVKVGKDRLEAGKDFLFHPSSPSYIKKSRLRYLSKAELVNLDSLKKALPDFDNRFVVIDKSLLKKESREIKNSVYQLLNFLKFTPSVKLNGVVELEEKLTYTASQELALKPHIQILKSKFNIESKTISVTIESEFNSNYQSQNVIGIIEGEEKDAFVYVVGHYDHLGRMGDNVYFPGANDNASGIAMLLSLAKDFASGNKPKKTIVFICFGAEEIGLVGSKYYTENPLLPLEEISFLINLDILGTGDDGVQVVNGSVFKEEFNELVEINKSHELLKEVKVRGAACNSDHCFFTEKGVPSFFMYTLGGVAHYHNIYDKAETLPLTEFSSLFRLLKEFVKQQ